MHDGFLSVDTNGAHVRSRPACHEPGETACGPEVEGETKGRPRHWHPRIIQNAAVKDIEDAVAGQGTNHDLGTQLDPTTPAIPNADITADSRGTV